MGLLRLVGVFLPRALYKAESFISQTRSRRSCSSDSLYIQTSEYVSNTEHLWTSSFEDLNSDSSILRYSYFKYAN